MLLFFLPSTLLYLCQNCFSSCASFEKLDMLFCSSTLDLLTIFWYLALADCGSERFELDCLILNFFFFFYFWHLLTLCLLVLYFYSTTLSFFFFDACISPKYSVAVVTMMSVNKFVCVSISPSVLLSGNLSI